MTSKSTVVHEFLLHGRGADLRTDDARSDSPDSEQIERTVAKPQMRNSVSVEQIQDRGGWGDIISTAMLYSGSDLRLQAKLH